MLYKVKVRINPYWDEKRELILQKVKNPNINLFQVTQIWHSQSMIMMFDKVLQVLFALWNT